MKNTKLILILAVGVILIIGIILFVSNLKASSPNQALIISPTPTPKPTSAPVSKYSAELKARVRGEFISNCQTKGHYSATECDCAANYLAKNYSEDELAKIYIQYRNSSQVPAALESARTACLNK